MPNYGNNPYEVELLTTQYTTLLELLLQQRVSKLRGHVETGMHVGKMASPVQHIGVLEAKAPGGRYTPLVPQLPQYTRRWVFPNDRDLAVMLDSFDELRSIVDPKSAINEAVIAAYNRFFDDLIFAAFDASASTGVDASSLTTESFDAGAIVADTFGASASTGMNYSKLVEAWRILRHYQNDLDGDMPTLIMGSQQESDLKKQQEVISRDYNDKPVVENGVITRLGGFQLLVSERTPTNGTLRNCFAWVKSGMYLGIWKDMAISISNRDDLSSNPWQLYSMASAGATRLQQWKVIKINCADTTGADPTAP
jgi:hypothetical protein